MTGNAEQYFAAFARCWPPHPLDGDGFARTRKYSIMHCRKRIRDGMAMMSGTKYCPPQPLSGREVADPLCWKYMHIDTNRSAMIFA